MCIKWSVVMTLLLATVVQADERPNVLWIIADDLRPQLGCYGDDVVKTPHIDQFATQALRFEHAYVQSAVCSPSRNSFLSGLRPNTTGLRGFGVKIRDVVPEIVTLPQHFKNHGYESRAFGKIYHIYDESMLGDEDDAQSWSAPTRWPEVPVWGPEQNELRDRLIASAMKAGKEFKHPHDWPRAETWDDSDVPDDEMQDGDTTAAVEKYLTSRRGNQEPGKACKKSALPLGAVWCNPLQNSQMPPLGLEESPKSSGKTGVSENHCADPCAQFSNSEQLAAIISGMDRNELEQRLLALLKEIQPDTSE